MPKNNTFLTAVAANEAGEIFELDGYAAVGMAGAVFEPLSVKNTLPMPHGSELMRLPDRLPIAYHIRRRRIEVLQENPFAPGEMICPVAAFNSPGHVISYAGAYRENHNAGPLPLFSYGAVGWHRGKFRSAVILVDQEKRQDLRLMKREDVVTGVEEMRKIMPENRLRAHLERCALTYGCPAAKNFFIGRYEAPLPTSRHCNAGCLGCLSFQQSASGIPVSQKRIDFTPTSDEIAEIALVHIKRVKKSVVSFGQGCEGDPLLAAHVIEPAIRRIRAETDLGTIHMNTNASEPETLEKLFDAGLDSVRISINSVREACYNQYFQPRGYRFSDVMQSMALAIRKNKFLSINYLNSPGFTDSPQEVDALIDCFQQNPINMIQWRNLNFDPLRYWRIMNPCGPHNAPIGMQTLLKRIKKRFPRIKFGYFNPPKETFNEMD
jgi:pyruvate-formate lyase-activating enzyme